MRTTGSRSEKFSSGAALAGRKDKARCAGVNQSHIATRYRSEGGVSGAVIMAWDVERSAGPTRTRFVATIFVGSFLLFLVQPMIARLALPRLGGAPSVWNSAMLVYQALLLGGY